jgi:hypothetical protein
MAAGAVVVLLLAALPGMALAQGPEPGTPPGGQGAGFVDEDGDGVCDLMGSGGRGQFGRRMGGGPGFVDENGDGVCDNFVDEDGDGVCDNCPAGQRMGGGRSATGMGGRMMGRGGGRW